MKPLIKVSKKQKELTDFHTELINGFFDRFVTHTDASKIYITWKIEARIGDVIDYMIECVNKALEHGKTNRLQ